MVKFQVDFDASQALTEAFKKIPDRAEKVTNDYLMATASETVIRNIIGLMPVGARKNPHAKHSNSLKKVMINLGFEIKPQNKFRYLVFPNDGIGFRNRKKQAFFELGLEKSESTIIKELINKLTEAATPN